MTGFNSFDDDPWILKLVDFTKKVLQQNRVRIIGVCFGHQIVGRAAGVEIGRSEGGWEVSVYPVELTEKGKELFQQDTLVSVGSRTVQCQTDQGCRASTRCTAMPCTSIRQRLRS